MKRNLLRALLYALPLLLSPIHSIAQKQWNVTGAADESMDELDAFMKAYMQNYGLRAGSIAVARNGKIIYAKGFTWAEPSYPVTTPISLFRIASCSKVITSFAIHQLVEKNQLTLETKAQSVLGLSDIAHGNRPLPFSAKPANLSTPGYYFSQISIRDLLDHRGGWDRDALGANDPTFGHDQDVATWGNNGKLPVSKVQLANWGALQKQQFYPGSAKHYSNYGYLLLGMVVEKKGGDSYINYVKKNLMNPLKIYRPQQSMPLQSQLKPGEVQYHDLANGSGPCATGTGNCPSQYGLENNANFDAFGGWTMSAVDYVKLIASYRSQVSPMPKVKKDSLITWFPNWGSTTGLIYEHGGLLPGTWSYMAHRSDGVDFMVVWNSTSPLDSFTYKGKKYGTGDHPKIWNGILDKITKWPTYDLSPAYFNDAATSAKSDFNNVAVWNAGTTKTIVARKKSFADFKKLYEQYYNQNYKLLSQQRYLLNGVEYYDGIWTSNAQGQFTAWGQSRTDFEKLYADWWAKGYRLIHQQSYVKNGQVLYDGIWNPNTGGQFVSWEKTKTEFEKQYVEMWQKGFRLIHQQTYTKDGQQLYNGIWNPSTENQAMALERNFADMKKLYDENFKKGFRAISLQAFNKNGQVLYNAVFNPSTNGQYVYWGNTTEGLDAEIIVKQAQNFQPVIISVY